MPKMEKTKADKYTAAFRLLRTTRTRLLKAITLTGLNMSSYVEMALIDKFKRDGIE